jgi:hypothetical protein
MTNRNGRSAQELLETRAVMFPPVDGWFLPDNVSTLFSQGPTKPYRRGKARRRSSGFAPNELLPWNWQTINAVAV